MISGVIHCFITTVHTSMFLETAIRAETILTTNWRLEKLMKKRPHIQNFQFFSLEICQFYLAM